jgi:hypothetical protein
MAHNPATSGRVSPPCHVLRQYKGTTASRNPADGTLREARALAAHAPAAPIAPTIALMALAALGIFGHSVHEPVHARGPCALFSGYSRSDVESFIRVGMFSASGEGCREVPRRALACCYSFLYDIFKGAPAARQVPGQARIAGRRREVIEGNA